MNMDSPSPPIVETRNSLSIVGAIQNRGTNERKTGGLCEISLHFCKSGRKTGGLLAKCEISLHLCK